MKTLDCSIYPDKIWGVYVFQEEHKCSVKIGWTSSSVQTRLNSGKTWRPNLIWLADSNNSGTSEKERQIHDQFANCRIDREWFTLTPELALWIWDNLKIRLYTDELMQCLTSVDQLVKIKQEIQRNRDQYLVRGFHEDMHKNLLMKWHEQIRNNKELFNKIKENDLAELVRWTTGDFRILYNKEIAFEGH